MAETKIEKNIKTRIKLKYGSCAELMAENPTLLAGEVAIAYLGPTQTPTNPDNGTHPVLFKVGPGEFNSLPWASALAADVYEWAKKNGIHINGTGNAVTEVGIDDEGYLAFTKGETFATKAELEELRGGLEADSNTRYSFEIPSSGDHAQKLVIKKKDISDTTFVDYQVVDVITQTELDNALVTKLNAGDWEMTENNVLEAFPYQNGGVKLGQNSLDVLDGARSASYHAHGLQIDDLSGNSIILNTNNDENPQLVMHHEYYNDGTEVKNTTVYTTEGIKYNDTTLSFPVKTQNSTLATLDDITLANLGLTGPMNFRGKGTVSIDENNVITITVPDVTAFAAGDVVITDAGIEYVYDGSNWHELGNEGSHALKSITISGGDGLTGGGDLSQNRIISLSEATKISLGKADNALPANGWTDNYAKNGWVYTNNDNVTVAEFNPTGLSFNDPMGSSSSVTLDKTGLTLEYGNTLKFTTDCEILYNNQIFALPTADKGGEIVVKGVNETTPDLSEYLKAAPGWAVSGNGYWLGANAVRYASIDNQSLKYYQESMSNEEYYTQLDADGLFFTSFYRNGTENNDTTAIMFDHIAHNDNIYTYPEASGELVVAESDDIVYIIDGNF